MPEGHNCVAVTAVDKNSSETASEMGGRSEDNDDERTTSAVILKTTKKIQKEVEEVRSGMPLFLARPQTALRLSSMIRGGRMSAD